MISCSGCYIFSYPACYQDEEIERLENEVEQWMAASEQLQKLGEDAVAEVYSY